VAEDLFPADDRSGVELDDAGDVEAGARIEPRVDADVAATHVTVVVVRPLWDGRGEPTGFPVARLRWTAVHMHWSLYWCDRNLRLHRYDRVLCARAPSESTEARSR